MFVEVFVARIEVRGGGIICVFGAGAIIGVAD